MSGYQSDEQAAVNQLGAEEQAKLDVKGTQSGPGVPQSPNNRVQTGAIDATQAAEQLAEDAGADQTKPINEQGKNI